MMMKKDFEASIAASLSILRGETAYDTSLYDNPLNAAESILKEVLSNDPKCAAAWIALGICYAYMPVKYPEAMNAYKQAVGLNPNDASVYYRIGNLLFLSGERGLRNISKDPYEDALSFLLKAMELNYEPEAAVLTRIGECFFRKEDYPESVSYFEKALSIVDKRCFLPSAWFLAAEAYEKLRDFPQAIKMYREYMKYTGSEHDEEIQERVKSLRQLI